MKTVPRFATFGGQVALGAVAALLGTGCLGVFPRPVSTSKVAYGRQLTPADVAFIKPGQTTRAAVVSQLGGNHIALPQQRALAYSWEMKGGGWVWWWCIVSMYGGAADAGSVPGGWRAYFVAFDDSGVVSATEFKSPSTRRSLHEHLYVWVHRLPAPAVRVADGLATR